MYFPIKYTVGKLTENELVFMETSLDSSSITTGVFTRSDNERRRRGSGDRLGHHHGPIWCVAGAAENRRQDREHRRLVQVYTPAITLHTSNAPLRMGVLLDRPSDFVVWV